MPFFNERLKCLAIKQKVETVFFLILDKVDELQNSIEQGLKSNDTLHTLLAMTVQIGNYLNHGTLKGNSKGFKISILTTLS